MAAVRHLRWALIERARLVRHAEGAFYQRLVNVRWVGPPAAPNESVVLYASVKESTDRATGEYLEPGTLYATTRSRFMARFQSVEPSK